MIGAEWIGRIAATALFVYLFPALLKAGVVVMTAMDGVAAYSAFQN